MINETHPKMVNPVSRVALAISYLKGEVIEEWANQQLVLLNDRITNQGVARNDMNLWRWFINDFHNTWRDKAFLEDAQMKLQNLAMKTDDDVDTYIAKFNALITELMWQVQHAGTVRAFKQGLKKWIQDKVYDRDQYPAEDDLQGWQDSARAEVTRSQLKKQEGGGYGKGGSTIRENQMRTFLGLDRPQRGGQRPSGRPQPRNRDPDAMDVDTAEVKPIRKGGFQ